MTHEVPASWPMMCPECSERVTIELPADAEAGRTATAECSRGHHFMVEYDGVTVEMLGALNEKG